MDQNKQVISLLKELSEKERFEIFRYFLMDYYVRGRYTLSNDQKKYIEKSKAIESFSEQIKHEILMNMLKHLNNKKNYYFYDKGEDGLSTIYDMKMFVVPNL